jgi:hypothetical protein
MFFLRALKITLPSVRKFLRSDGNFPQVAINAAFYRRKIPHFERVFTPFDKKAKNFLENILNSHFSLLTRSRFPTDAIFCKPDRRPWIFNV